VAKITVQLVSITNLSADGVPEEIAASPIIGQLLTREDGASRLIYLGNNDDNDSDEEVIANSPAEVVPVALLQMGLYQIVDGATLAGADVRVLAELPSIEDAA